MKIKLFSHTDLDGVGCAIVAAHAFGAENVDVVHCDYHNVDEKVESFFLHAPFFNYDLILITDISVNDTVAELIETKIQSSVRNGWSGSVALLDHHPTAVGLNKYYWATVTPVKVEEYVYPQDKETMAKELRGEIASTIKTSGTTMLYDYVISNSIIEHNTALYSFAEQVRRYDTWDWHDVFNDEYPKRLNDLMYIVGRESFFDRFSKSLDLKFTLTETLLVENEEKKIKKYIDTKNKQLVKYSIHNKRKWFKPFEKRIGLVAGVVYADQYVSELGNSLAISNQDIDFIVMIDMGSNKISYRGIKTDKIDLGKFAKSLGGGGHAPAAGSQIDSRINESLMPSLFKPFSVKKIS